MTDQKHTHTRVCVRAHIYIIGALILKGKQFCFNNTTIFILNPRKNLYSFRIILKLVLILPTTTVILEIISLL